MPRLPIIAYTLLAACAFLLGLKQLDLFESPSGKTTHLFTGIFLLAMVGAYIYGGLFLNDGWKKDEKENPTFPTKPLLPVKKNEDRD